MIDEAFLTTDEVLEYLQVNLRTVYRLIKAGKIPAVQFFTAVPFGPSIGEYIAWKWFGGGNDWHGPCHISQNRSGLR